jgi:hypothetical protein
MRYRMVNPAQNKLTLSHPVVYTVHGKYKFKASVKHTSTPKRISLYTVKLYKVILFLEIQLCVTKAFYFYFVRISLNTATRS